MSWNYLSVFKPYIVYRFGTLLSLLLFHHHPSTGNGLHTSYGGSCLCLLLSSSKDKSSDTSHPPLSIATSHPDLYNYTTNYLSLGFLTRDIRHSTLLLHALCTFYTPTHALSHHLASTSVFVFSTLFHKLLLSNCLVNYDVKATATTPTQDTHYALRYGSYHLYLQPISSYSVQFI